LDLYKIDRYGQVRDAIHFKQKSLYIKHTHVKNLLLKLLTSRLFSLEGWLSMFRLKT